MCAIATEHIDRAFLLEITGLLADSGELDLGKGGILSDPLFVYQRVEMQGPVACAEEVQVGHTESPLHSIR